MMKLNTRTWFCVNVSTLLSNVTVKKKRYSDTQCDAIILIKMGLVVNKTISIDRDQMLKILK